MNTQLFNQVLADFAQEFGLGTDKRVLLVIDQAGWHTSRGVIVPEGLHLTQLPAYSPELQPAERLWSVVDEPIVNQCFESLENLEATLYARCQTLLRQQDFIRGLTNFYWWQEIGV